MAEESEQVFKFYDQSSKQKYSHMLGSCYTFCKQRGSDEWGMPIRVEPKLREEFIEAFKRQHVLAADTVSTYESLLMYR